MYTNAYDIDTSLIHSCHIRTT